MATLAQAVSATPPNPESDLWTISADLSDAVDYLQVESEIVRVVGNFPAQYQRATATTSVPKIRVERAAGGTTAASHAGGTTLTPLIPPAAGGGGTAAPGTVVVTPPNEVDIGAALDATVNDGHAPDASNAIATIADTSLANVLVNGNDADGRVITNLGDPSDPQDAATKNYVDTASPVPTLAAVLAEGADTGGTSIVHIPAVDTVAGVSAMATATGTGEAFANKIANAVNAVANAESQAVTTGSGPAIAGPRATTIDGNAFAASHATATGDGNTDACAYARSVDGAALADNDAAATGTGLADAGGYAMTLDGNAFTGGVATANGAGNADASDIATATDGDAIAGSLAVRQGVEMGMRAIVDGTSGRMGFNGVTPIARPVIPPTPDAQDIADVLVALGLVTQAA